MEVSRFNLGNLSELSRNGFDRDAQGIYCSGKKLYKVYSYRSSGVVKRNDIAVFTMPGNSPSFSGTATLNTIYSCDRTDKDFFEIESISSPDSGNTMYMLANVKENNKPCDKIYSISLP